MKLCVGTARQVGETCRDWAAAEGYELVPMEECEVFISVLYDKILKADFLAGRRCYNFHPGLLPQYRGSGAFSWAILNGDRETGVTLHEIDGDIDHGPVIDIERFPIWDHDTAGTLFDQAATTIFQMFREWLPRLLAGDVHSVPQDESMARYYPRRALEGAKDISRYARAFHFPGKEQAYYFDRKRTKRHLSYDDP